MAGKITGVPQVLLGELAAAWDARSAIRDEGNDRAYWASVRDAERAMADLYQKILRYTDSDTPIRMMTLDAQSGRRRSADFAQIQLDRLAAGSGMSKEGRTCRL